MSSILAQSRPGFRPDINGLRAWAVLLVILYHFGIPGFDGGFLGVDVFFVISGFLMTSIIVEGLTTERFSLWQFYLARARRIFPALAVLCVIEFIRSYLGDKINLTSLADVQNTDSDLFKAMFRRLFKTKYAHDYVGETKELEKALVAAASRLNQTLASQIERLPD